MVAGSGHWRTGEGEYRIAGRHFLVLNRGQAYGLEMERGGTRESFCPMFRHGFVEDIARSLVETTEVLLDEPVAGECRPLTFSEHVRDPDDVIVPRLLAMHAGFRRGEGADWLSDRFHFLAEALVVDEALWRRRAGSVPALRASTRQELWRRLHRARDYIHANATGPIDLAAIARVACLSPHHFHRLFRKAFGETPHRYRTRLRLARAAVLLKGRPCVLSGRRGTRDRRRRAGCRDRAGTALRTACERIWARGDGRTCENGRYSNGAGRRSISERKCPEFGFQPVAEYHYYAVDRRDTLLQSLNATGVEPRSWASTACHCLDCDSAMNYSWLA